MKWKRYSGAGILFVSASENEGREDGVLLGCRKGSGVWSIPGGASEKGEEMWETAARETTEEFGEIPGDGRICFWQRFPFGPFGFDWTTFVFRLEERPLPSVFPNHGAKDFYKKFREAKWFPVGSLPPKTHHLLRPVLWRLKFAGR